MAGGRSASAPSCSGVGVDGDAGFGAGGSVGAVARRSAHPAIRALGRVGLGSVCGGGRASAVVPAHPARRWRHRGAVHLVAAVAVGHLVGRGLAGRCVLAGQWLALRLAGGAMVAGGGAGAVALAVAGLAAGRQLGSCTQRVAELRVRGVGTRLAARVAGPGERCTVAVAAVAQSCRAGAIGGCCLACALGLVGTCADSAAAQARERGGGWVGR